MSEFPLGQSRTGPTIVTDPPASARKCSRRKWVTDVMLVSEGSDPAADIFERTDRYRAYVKPEQTPDATKYLVAPV